MLQQTMSVERFHPGEFAIARHPEEGNGPAQPFPGRNGPIGLEAALPPATLHHAERLDSNSEYFSVADYLDHDFMFPTMART